jgi:hypothetical protein
MVDYLRIDSYSVPHSCCLGRTVEGIGPEAAEKSFPRYNTTQPHLVLRQTQIACPTSACRHHRKQPSRTVDSWPELAIRSPHTYRAIDIGASQKPSQTYAPCVTGHSSRLLFIL